MSADDSTSDAPAKVRHPGRGWLPHTPFVWRDDDQERPSAAIARQNPEPAQKPPTRPLAGRFVEPRPALTRLAFAPSMDPRTFFWSRTPFYADELPLAPQAGLHVAVPPSYDGLIDAQSDVGMFMLLVDATGAPQPFTVAQPPWSNITEPLVVGDAAARLRAQFASWIERDDLPRQARELAAAAVGVLPSAPWIEELLKWSVS